jgi:cyclopropane-fatty-acyl-phospholipid synthase
MGLADAVVHRSGAVANDALRSGVARLAEACLASGGAALRVVLPDGSVIDFGQSARVVLRILDTTLLADMAAPTLALLGDAYIEGRLEIEGDLLEALPIGERLIEAGGSSVTQRVVQALRRHRRTEDRSAIRHHYDVGNEFYRLWLDERMVYSCAYYRAQADTIDSAQTAKLEHVCRKLALAPGERLLDVGCGWGALPIYAAQEFGVRAVGITLSENQAQLARERVKQLGLQDRVEILLLDYRDLTERFGVNAFDKAASIGMFEHVGLRNLPAYFAAVASVLRDRGVFLNHGITSSDVDNLPVGGGASEFIARHVFPHGELPHLHLAAREMSAAGFEIVDAESLRPHYARTLTEWYRRLDAHIADAARLVAPRTLRTWLAYLAGCAYGFERGWVNVYQLLGSRQATPGLTRLPMTRDWIYA